MASLPSSDRAPGAIPRAPCWERVGSVGPNSWYLSLVPRDLAACAHSGRHYGEQARAVPVARTRAQELVFAGEAFMRTLPALAPGNLTAVLPLQQGHPRIRTHDTARKGPRSAKRRRKVQTHNVPEWSLRLPFRFPGGISRVHEEDRSGRNLRGTLRAVRA